MPLDPQAEALLRQLESFGLPPLDALPPVQAREVFDAAFATPPDAREPVARVEELSLDGAAGSLRARLYAPASDGPLPCVLFFHGGGWVIMNLETHDGFCRSLANRARCAVVSVDYRLAPEHRFPAAADDCYAALVAVSKRAASLGLDPTRLAVAGDSAGGNLSAAVALMARDREGPALRLQVLIYPALDPACDTVSCKENAEGYLLTLSSMHYFWGHYLGAERRAPNAYAAPALAESLSGLPAAFVITAEYDPLRDEGEAYARRLEAEGVPTTLARHEGMIHGFVLMPQAMDQAKQATDAIAARVRTAFAVS
jgi:acetyl esterase